MPRRTTKTLQVFNITDVTQSKGYPVRVFRNSVGIRKSITISAETYQRYAKKLNRLVQGGQLFIGAKLPKWVLEARQRKRKPLPEETAEATPRPEPSPLAAAVKDLVAGKPGAAEAIEELSAPMAAQSAILSLTIDDVKKGQIQSALEELDLPTTGNKEPLFNDLMTVVKDMSIDDAVMLTIKGILIPQE